MSMVTGSLVLNGVNWYSKLYSSESGFRSFDETFLVHPLKESLYLRTLPTIAWF